jgi:threonine dehydratase
MHPLGSHKGRSIPHMIDVKIAEGCRHFVISSSGNAALAAGLYVKKLNEEGKDITLEILAGKNINPNKLKKLEALKDSNILVSIQDRPLQTLFVKVQQDPTIQSLRQSNDDDALVGYESLAKELLEIPKLKAVFIGTSSGTTAEALANYFKNKVEVHIVQTSSCHPMADAFVENFSSEEKSIADAIVDITAVRKDAVAGTVAGGWIVMNEEIKAAQDIVKRTTDLSISTNSALSVAGLMQAVYTGKEFKGAVACVICGE